MPPRESGTHRKREEASRRAELRLVTLEPFIQGMSTDEQDKARAQALEAVFLEPAADHDESASLTEDHLSLFQNAAEVISKIRR